jgi:hypothetical protein
VRKDIELEWVTIKEGRWKISDNFTITKVQVLPSLYCMHPRKFKNLENQIQSRIRKHNKLKG